MFATGMTRVFPYCHQLSRILQISNLHPTILAPSSDPSVPSLTVLPFFQPPFDPEKPKPKPFHAPLHCRTLTSELLAASYLHSSPSHTKALYHATPTTSILLLQRTVSVPPTSTVLPSKTPFVRFVSTPTSTIPSNDGSTRWRWTGRCEWDGHVCPSGVDRSCRDIGNSRLSWPLGSSSSSSSSR